MNEIYVTGHRNPDTDSIVAAMSYAALKNALGEKEYVAVHLGTISDETNRMLERFHFKPPRCIQNVRTQVQDLDFDRPPCLDASVTMDRAWKLMRDQKISAIPVVNEDGTLYGMLSAGDIATFSLNTVGDPKVEEIPLFNLLSVIEGRIMGDGGELVDSVSGTVSIALPQNCENLLFDSADSIVLCGSQPDMIRRALDRQVDCLILCQTDVEPEWLENAGKTCVISTPLDASRVHRLIYQATPISRPCATDDLISFHMDDYIDDVREVVLKSRYRCYPVLDAEEKVVGTLSRYHLLRPRRKQVVLVDHNELAQTVPGIEQAEILGIIDHHPPAHLCPQRAGGQHQHHHHLHVPGARRHALAPHGGPDGLGHPVRHGHVQVPHLHQARHRHGRAPGPHRQGVSEGSGPRAVQRQQRRQVRRGTAAQRL